MSYTKQNFKSGEKLYASQLNAMDEQIRKNEQALSDIPENYQSKGNYQPAGNYLTEHQPLKTINGQSLVGEGDIIVEGGASNGYALVATSFGNGVVHLTINTVSATPSGGVHQAGNILNITSGVEVAQINDTVSIA